MTQNQSNPEMKNIEITRDVVEKMLNNLNQNKASGPDKISPRLMQTLSKEIAPFLKKSLRPPWKSVLHQMIGNQLLLHLFIKKDQNVKLVIIAPYL